MPKVIILVIISILISPTQKVLCNHVVGGEINYECLGEGSNPNSFTIRVNYSSFEVCEFEFTQETKILRKWIDGLFTDLILNLDTFNVIETIDYSCVQNESNFCYVKNYYSNEFEFIKSDSEIYLEARSCCRDADIINLDANGLSLGAVYMIDLSTFAQQECNNSPNIENNLPASFCKNEFFELNLAGNDIENDQIIYEFCAPLNTPSEPVDVPDFPSLPFNFPDYGPLYPLGQGVLSLDPNLGILSGIPSNLGSFVVGICVTEYRNGQYLSKTRRDIQINVTDCIPYVQADMNSDSITDESIFIINSCNQPTINFENLSIEENNINSQLWTIDMGTDIVTSDEWNPTIFFEEAGTYSGNLVINPNEECSDSIDFIVNIVTDIIPDFTTIYDTCISGPVKFFNNSYANGSELSFFEWSFGDSTYSYELEVEKIYQNPGIYDVQLKVIDEFGCADSINNVLDWRPAPAIIIAPPRIPASCAPLETKLINLSWPIDSTYSFEWDFGDGTFVYDEINPMHTYSKHGTYDIFVSVTSPIGCIADTLFEQLILVEEPPAASFNYLPTALTSFNSIISITDFSERAVHWHWLFDQVDSSYIQEPIYEFADTGFHTVRLVVKDIYGCTDTLVQKVDVIPAVTYFLPNAFSPNGDGQNDVFQAKGILEYVTDFQIKIFNRWGQIVFESFDPEINWSGFDQTNNQFYPNGVYSFIIRYKISRGNIENKTGFVTIVN